MTKERTKESQWPEENVVQNADRRCMHRTKSTNPRELGLHTCAATVPALAQREATRPRKGYSKGINPDYNLAMGAGGYGYTTNVVIDSDDTWLGTWSNDDIAAWSRLQRPTRRSTDAR
jgi:hypothetical protein